MYTHNIMWIVGVLVLLVFPRKVVNSVRVETIEFRSDKDTTICETEDASLSFSNARGDGLYIGKISQGLARRSLVYFDVSELRGELDTTSDIESASFILYERRINWPDDSTITVHRVLEPWDEGSSSAVGGKCQVSSSADASWTLRNVGTNVTWMGGAGGTFEETPSATIQVSIGDEEYIWTGTGLLEDVRKWINGSEPNYGWIVIGNEIEDQTAKSFGSREYPDETKRPHLLLELRNGINSNNNTRNIVVPIIVTLLIVLGVIILAHMFIRYKRSATAPLRSVYNPSLNENLDDDHL
eukprot:m.44957 g.44957  ORF g.44957 m.44957 type:complete len:298 (+) comp10643_c0_seq2:69-962(+)